MSQADIETINGLHEEGLAAANAADLASLMNLWTEDAVRMPPNEPAAIGKASIETQYRAMFDEFTTDLHVQSQETEVLGDWAYSRWTCSGVFAPKAGGEPIRGEFKCVDIFRKQQDGTWKMALHIWNSNERLPTSEANKGLVRRFYEEGLNKRNMTIVNELLDPGYVYHGVVEGEIKGVGAMKQFLTSLYTAIPDDQHMIQEQIAEGDKVVTRFKSSGTTQVEFMGVTPSGKPATVEEVTISRIAGGRIVEDWNTWGVHGLLQQLGAAPQPTEANKALARRFFDDFLKKREWTLADEIFADKIVFPVPPVAELHGPEAVKQLYIEFLARFPDFRFPIEELISEGDKVVVRWSFTGTHKGEWMGVAPTGKPMSVVGTTTLRIAGGKIVEHRADWDALGLFQQLGVMPPLGKGEERAAA